MPLIFALTNICLSMDHLKKLWEEGYVFNWRLYFFNGWQIFKKNASSYMGFVVISTFISLFLGLVPGIGALAATFWINPVLSTGYFFATKSILENGSASFNDFFKGFKFSLPLIGTTAISYFIYLLVFSPSLYQLYHSGLFEWYQEMMKNPLEPPTELPPIEEKISTLILFNLLPIIFLWISFLFSSIFVVFENLGSWKALEWSRTIIFKRWWSFFRWALTFVSLFFLAYFPAALIATASPQIGIVVLLVLIILAFLVLVPIFYISLYLGYLDITTPKSSLP